MTDNLNSINSNEETGHKGGLLERIRQINQKALIPAIASVSIWGAPVMKGVGLTAAGGAIAATLTSCGDEPERPNNTEVPKITPNQTIIDISGGKKKAIIDENNGQLKIGNTIVATRPNKYDAILFPKGKENELIQSGTVLDKEGIITLKVINSAANLSSTLDITLKNQPILGLENLESLVIQVDQEVNLLNGIILGEGVSWEKVEIEKDGQIKEITDPGHAVFDDPGTCNIILTVKKDGEILPSIMVPKDIKPLEFKSIEINYYRPEEILPIIGQVTEGDTHVYEHIEYLRPAEVTVAIDMMWKYGAGNYSSAEYQQLMNRLNTGMNLEKPLGYDNYEFIGCNLEGNPTDHAYSERHTLNTLVKHANFKIIGENKENSRYSNLNTFIKNNPNSINIFGCSAYGEEYSRSKYIDLLFEQDIVDMLNSGNLIIFSAGTNINQPGGVLKNKIYNGDYDADENGMYSLASMSNSKKNSKPNSHLLVTIATDADGDIDQTNEIYQSSKYPVGFANNMLFSGRAFPKQYYSGEVVGEGKANHGKYATSHTNYVNVAMTCLCFQMNAGVPNVNQLLHMIRSSALTDYIRFNGETQELQLINPAGFFEAFDLPNDLPSQINSGEIIPLNKGFYKGLIFDIPGAEAYINGQWIAYNNANESIIKAQNPFNIKWRLNGNLCRKMGYKGKTIQGRIIAVDDKRKGLNMEKRFIVNME